MLPIPVFRVEKNANYTTMSNYHLRDSTTSFKAKGILSMFLSLPKDWSYSVSGLAAISKEGKDGILSGLKELEAAGYLERHRYRNEQGRLGDSEYVIYEIPRHVRPVPATPNQVFPTRTQFEGIQDRSSANTFSELCSFPIQRRDFYGKCSDRQCNLCCQSGFCWR